MEAGVERQNETWPEEAPRAGRPGEGDIAGTVGWGVWNRGGATYAGRGPSAGVPSPEWRWPGLAAARGSSTAPAR